MDVQRRELNILVAIDEVPDPVWERLRPMASLRFERDGLAAYQALTRERFDVTFIDLHLTGMDSLELLRRVHAERLCPAVVLTSLTPSFSYAQQGILYGVSAYLLRPLRAEDVAAAIRKLMSTATIPDHALWEAAKAVAARLRDEDAAQMFLRAGNALAPPPERTIEGSMRWRDLYEEVVKQAFRLYPWLALYHAPAEYEALDYVWESDGDMVANFCQRNLARLADSIRALFPRPRNPQMEEILLLLLETVDENAQQKDVAERYYITNSTLSTRFQRNLGMSYRAYMTRLKICRGEYLLRYTDIAADELAARLGYKDREHFAKLFLQHTGRTIQECGQRIWGEEYDI